LSGDPFESVVTVLRDALGDEAARRLVEREAHAASLASIESERDLTTLLTRIEGLGGTAGLAAKLAMSRHRRGVPLSTSAPTTVRGATNAAQAPSETYTIHALATLLARSLGDEKAHEVIVQAMTDLDLKGSRLAHKDAARVLDLLGARGGVVGTVAQFAKVRFMLK
jgi:hypothetical protein